MSRRGGRPGVPHSQGIRLVKLLRLLEATPAGIEADELAAAFDVSPRTLRRDFLALAFAREPIECAGGRWRLGVRP